MRVTYLAPVRSSSRIRCTHALNERQVREGLVEVPKVPASVRFYLLEVPQQQRAVIRPVIAVVSKIRKYRGSRQRPTTVRWRPGHRLPP